MLLTLLFVFVMQMTVMAAGETVTMHYCYIEGDQVNVIVSGTAASDDGNYYLFALKTYEAGVGARTDYCAVAPAAETVHFTTPLGLDTAASKLYSRFVVTALRGGAFVPVSTEMYITNPEVVAKGSTTSIAEATGNKKGLYCTWQYADYLSDLGAGYVASLLNTADFFNAGGINYTYNGKTYQFNAGKVQETDILVRLYNAQNVDIVMTIVNGYNAGTADMVYPEALGVPGKHPNYYAFNVENQSGEEKLEAFMSFIAERYNGGMYGSIHNYVIGNEVNSSDSWHYAGEISVEDFSVKYAKQFRVCYNAIKSHNLGANVYMCTDQRWLHNDGGSSYGGKPVIDGFNAEILRTGNINWGLSFHPYPVPLANTQFWTTAPGYAALKLVDHTENTKMIIPTNMEVVTNYMQKPEYLAPSGAVRNLFISELGFNSLNMDENIQAAALVYAFKLIQANPYIKGVTINSIIDNDWEVVNDKLAVGLMRSDTAQKPAYHAFQIMDKGNTDHFLPYIGASSWAQLGVQ